ncbi:hypothetical protein PCAR4_830053 [Paraburkholderia caribensis]|nr:hypothetical protein PCAR4_830053 [Paraburkholderia caribensis]
MNIWKPSIYASAVYKPEAKFERFAFLLPIRKFMFARDLPWSGDATVPRPFFRRVFFLACSCRSMQFTRMSFADRLMDQGIARQRSRPVRNLSPKRVSGRIAGGL